MLPLCGDEILCGVDVSERDMAQEKRMAHIHGINEWGEVLTIAVYRKDGATRLSYLAESHYV